MTKQKKQNNVPRALRRLFPQVSSCEDARAPVEVQVTRGDCAAGKKLQSSECAMARAVKRQYRADGAVIGITFSYVIRGDRAIRFKTPVSVAREIVSFDRHHDFAPGEYRLSAVEPSQRLGSKKKKDHSGPKKQKRIIYRETARVRTSR